ncbi:MAG: TonB-dependent receptor, partial [Acidobacteriota bacterium]|nr:TonB-dependent receptor [Acidobacteriota bacterium]
SGIADLLQTDRAEVARNFTTKSVVELPLANRSFQALAGLVAGVTPPTVDFTTQEDPQGTTFFRANGNGNSSNNTLVDGIDNTNPTLGLSIYIPSAEVVQEVHVTTSNYNAEFGRAGGAVINAVTRGGTNEFHGSLWEFNRIANLRARDFFNKEGTPKPAFIRNEYGAAVGGPVLRNKTFFFGAYQGRKVRQSANSTSSLPNPAWLNGDFSATPGVNIFDPFTGNPDGTGRQQFPNNTIPQSRFHPVAAALLKSFPQANRPGFSNNFNTNVPFTYDGNSYDARVDHNFTEQTKIFAKFNTALYNVLQKAPLGDVIGEGTTAKDYTITASLNLTHGFSPTLLTEARLGYNRYRTNVNGINNQPGISQQLGIANPSPDDISSKGLARIQINGMAGIGAPVFYPLINTDNLFTAVNTWSKILSNHAFKWGVEAHRVRADRFQPQGLNLGPRGLFQFNPGTTALVGGPPLGPNGTFANSFASFLLGTSDQVSRTFMPITPTNRQTQFFSFFQDTYQFNTKLTLDIGLRYELYTTVQPRYKGGASNYDPSINTLLVAGYGDIPLSTNVDVMPHNFAPRIGVAYRLDSKSVIRAGYGISYWTGRFGFTGGTLSTQFPVIYNIQQGAANSSVVAGSLSSIPPVALIPIPSNGRINPAPNQAFFVIPRHNPIPYVQSYNVTYQRELAAGIAVDVSYVGNLGRQEPFNLSLNAAPAGTGIGGRPLNRLFGHTADVSLRGNGVNSN